MLSAGKRYTLLARIAARGDLGPRRSGLPRGVFFPAVDGEKSTTKNPRDGASARTETVDGGRPRRGDRLRSGDSGSSRTRRFRSLGFSRTSLPGVGGTTAGAGRNARQPTVASRDGAISPETHLGGTALDDHESALANGTGLHGDGGGRAGIGGLEFLDVGVVRHGWMLRLLGRVPCAAGKGLYRECLRLLGARTDEDPAPIVCMVRQSGEIPSVFTKMITSSARFPSARLFLPRSIHRVGCSRPRERGGLPMRRTLAAALAGVSRRVVPRSCLSGASPSCAARSTAWHAHASAVPSSGHFAHASAAASGSEPFAGRPRSDAGSKPGGSTDRASGAGAMRGFVAINKRIIQCVDGTHASAPPANRFGRDVFPKRATNRFFGRRVRSDERFARPSWTFVSS